MVSSLNIYRISAISLACRFIPTDIILSVFFRPNRYLNSTNTFRTINITDNDIKSTSIFIVINYWNGTYWFIMFYVYNCFSDIMTLVGIIYDIKVSTVIA